MNDEQERKMNMRKWAYERALTHDLGKLVLCRYEKSKTQDGYRAYLQNMDTGSNIMSREGWWNAFSYCIDNVLVDKSNHKEYTIDDNGIWLSIIDDIRQDKRGYVNFILKPITRISNSIEDIIDSPALGYLKLSNAFATFYVSDIPDRNINFDEVVKQLQIENSVDTLSTVIDRLKSGTLSITTLNTWVSTPTKFELLADDWECNTNEYAEKYPHTAKRIPIIMYQRGEIDYRDIFKNGFLEDILRDWSIQDYVDNGVDINVNDTPDDIARKLEIFWANKDATYAAKREAEKAERKAKRLARKKQKKG